MQRRTHPFQQNLIGKASGCIALVCTFLLLGRNGSDPLIAIASLFFIAICLTDTLHAKITNSTNLLMCMGGLGYQLSAHGPEGLLIATTGLMAGLALLLVPYIMGGVGGGDIKALAALGALVGPVAIFQIFLYVGLIGGVIALAHYLFSVRPTDLKNRCFGWMTAALAVTCTQKPALFMPADPATKQRFPYAAAIALGFFAFTSWGGLL